MSKYPAEKYQIIVHQHPTYLTTEIIAKSTYAGQAVKGKAICHIKDEYNEELGKELAIARCAEKISRKRKARAAKLLAKAKKQMELAQKYVDDMTHYYESACAEVEDAQLDLKTIIART